MAKRDTVNLDCDKIDILRKANQWNQSAFSRKVGKYSSWYSEVLRGKNLPSPEEAAHICILFNVSPDDILMHEGKTPEETAKCLEDIETVRKLVETERAKENAHDQKTVGAMRDDDEDFKEAVELLKKMDKETLRVFVKAARGAVGE